MGIEESTTTKEEQTSPQLLPSNILPSQRIVGEVPTGKKRRREEVDDDGSGGSMGSSTGLNASTIAELRAEVKRLRQELAVKDDTIRHMREILQVGAVGLASGRS